MKIKKIINNLFRRSFEWKTNIVTVEVDGWEWECWTIWCWTWQWCKIGKEQLWYDGSHDIWFFGIASLYRGYDSSYSTRRLITEQKYKNDLS
jgi:hypothetical protein